MCVYETSFSFQDGTEAGVPGGRRRVRGTGERLASRQEGLSRLRQPGNPQSRSALLRESRGYVVSGSHLVHHAARKVGFPKDIQGFIPDIFTKTKLQSLS